MNLHFNVTPGASGRRKSATKRYTKMTKGLWSSQLYFEGLEGNSGERKDGDVTGRVDGEKEGNSLHRREMGLEMGLRAPPPPYAGVELQDGETLVVFLNHWENKSRMLSFCLEWLSTLCPASTVYQGIKLNKIFSIMTNLPISPWMLSKFCSQFQTEIFLLWTFLQGPLKPLSDSNPWFET